MKTIFLVLTVACLHFSAIGHAQRITIVKNNMTIAEIFKEIEHQANMNFFYKHNEVNDIPAMSLNLRNVELRQVLDRVFDPGVFNVVVEKKTIIVNRKRKSEGRSPDGLHSANDVADTKAEKDLKGKVTDAVTGEPLGGATVEVKGTVVATLSDNNGSFLLEGVKSGDVIVVRYTGYKSREVRIGNETSIVIKLDVDIQDLEEVVITGYQKIDKRTFTGSVGKVNPTDMATAGIGDVSKAIQGMVAGVAVENTSGTFGTKSKIRIRGNSSISGNQEPLWVVDGVVLDDPVNVNPNELYSGNTEELLSSAISGINPDDIEEIQILKDASATAMYGTQAVNGVIVVTTKKGKVGPPVVNYRADFTLNQKPSIQKFNVMNSKQRMELSEELYEKNIMDFTNLYSTYGAFGKLLDDLSNKKITWDEYYDEIQRAKTYNTDWFDVIFRNNLTQEHSVSLSTGNENAQYYMSGSYFGDNGQTRNQFVKRYNGNIKANFKLSKRFSITGSLNGSVRTQRSFGTFNETTSGGLPQRDFDINPYTYARTTSRAMRPFDDEGNLMFYQANFAPFNILHELDNNFVDIKLKELRFQLDGNYRIHRDLTYSFIVSAHTSSAMSEHISTENSNVAESHRAMQTIAIRNANNRLYLDPYGESQFKISILPRGGIAMVDNSQGDFYTIRNMINYKPVIKERHAFDLMAGSEIKERKYDRYSFTGYGLEYEKGMTASPDYRAIQRDQFSATGSPYYKMGVNIYREASFFANLAYSLNHKYNFTLSARADGSNRLGASERFRFLPIWVLGGSWNVDREQFMQDINWIDFLKLRASFGKRGNISGLGSPELLAYSGTTTRFDPDEVENIISITAPDNPSLQWEKEKMANLAVEVGLLSRLSATLEWYHRNNYDLIGNVEVSRASGFLRKSMNWADMVNKGYEVTLNMRTIDRKDFKWNTVVTYGYNKNTVTRLQLSNGVITQTRERGAPMLNRPVTGLYSFKFAGLNADGLPMFYNSRGHLTNSFSRYTIDLGMLNYEGSREPLGSGGLTNQFQYKDFNLSFLFTYSYGNKVRLNPVLQRYFSDVDAISAELANRWTTPGDEKYTNIPRIIEPETRSALLQANAEPFMAYNRSDIRVADGSFIRFKNLMFSYQFPRQFLERIKINQLRVNAQAHNLYLWADPNLKGQDPEAIVTGVFIPAMTTFSLGFNVNF